MPGSRSYDDPCGVARALDLVGERWALLVVRELLLGPKRFADLTRGLPGLSQNVLSQRLRQLEAVGLVRRRRLGPPASTRVYELTEHGSGLEAVLLALGRWGSRYPSESVADLSVDALMLALKTTFDPHSAAGLNAGYALLLGDDRFRVEVKDSQLHLGRGEAEHVDATLATDARTLRSLVFGSRTMAAAIQAGQLRLEGDRGAAERFASCFPRPPIVAVRR